MRTTRILGVLLAAVLLAACGDDDTVSSDDGSSSDGGTAASAYDGEYLATEVTEDGQPRPLVDGSEIRLRLDDGSLSANAGCNTIGGDYEIDDDVLRVGATSMTEMGCDPERHAQDEWLAGVLSSAPTIVATQHGFLLEAGATVLTFVAREVADPDVELTGTTWAVDGFLDGTGPDGTASSAPGDSVAEVVFDPNGFVTGHDGCNGFGYAGPMGGDPTDGLRYEVDGDRISFTGSAASTQIACPDVDTDRLWAVLSGTVTWDIEADRLTLVNDDDEGVTFRAEP